MKNPIPREDIYKYYWYFASERQNIFYNRFSGKAKPWTNDKILQNYKFCNVFRATDRVSQYLIKNVIYTPIDYDAKDRLFQIIFFRIFSNIETWESLVRILGRPPLVRDLKFNTLEEALDLVRQRNNRLYTNAFILCANNAYGKSIKHLNHIELFRDMFLKGDIFESVLNSDRLKNIYSALHSYPLLGDFMSYQISIDINYSELVDFSENDFTKAGPGALRGIKKVFSDTNGLSPEAVVMWMVENQESESIRLGLPPPHLWGRGLHAIDCQGLFCEVDKYCREAAPELASARKRIKSKFSESTDKINFFFPPKWGLNL
ncbi:MAG: nucleotide kinase domain-containing protein [Pseudomonadota bacterium]